MISAPDRRAFIAGLAAFGLAPCVARAESYIDLAWTDLLPEGKPAVPPILQELIDHSAAPLSSQQPASGGFRDEWSGETVRLPGFIVPIDQRGTGVTAFLLVPYVGACVHVPPPPANQLVFVNTETPYNSSGLFEPVHVIGTLQVSSIYTELAEAGYTLSADRIESYRA